MAIPPTAQMQLSAALAWIAVASGGRLTSVLIESIIRHHRSVRTEPGVLIAAAIQYLISGSDREADWLNRYWHIADQVSARERSRYLNTSEKELM